MRLNHSAGPTREGENHQTQCQCECGKPDSNSENPTHLQQKALVLLERPLAAMVWARVAYRCPHAIRAANAEARTRWLVKDTKTPPALLQPSLTRSAEASIACAIQQLPCQTTLSGTSGERGHQEHDHGPPSLQRAGPLLNAISRVSRGRPH